MAPPWDGGTKAYRIGRLRRPPHSLNIFSSKPTRPIKVKFHMELLWDGGTKVYSNSPGHINKMAAMPIYSKNLKKSSSLEPKGRWPWKLVCGIGYWSNTKFVQMVTLTYFMTWSNLVPCAFVWVKGKTIKFSETIVVFDVKVGRCSQPNEYMKLYEYQRSRWFTDLLPRSLRFNIFKFLFLRNH